MSRLIDADALIEEIANMDISEQSKIFSVNMLRTAPTAYDVEKVVKELEEWTFEADVIMPFDKTIMENRKIIASDIAIDIVQTGGEEND